jgi:hypothetical protein
LYLFRRRLSTIQKIIDAWNVHGNVRRRVSQ